MFRTEFKTSKSEIRINHKSKIITIGSCFSDSIGNKLKEYKFEISSNPFGTLFNPVSIFNCLSGKPIKDRHFIFSSEQWKHYDYHSSFVSTDKEQLKSKLIQTGYKFQEFLKKVDFLFITLGTAIIYELKETNLVIANCQKQPASSFNKRYLTSEEIINSFQQFYSYVKEINPKMEIIFTVSPVRHLKEGFEENAISKSILRTSVYSITSEFENCSYFPSYEIMLDDLRDYRFYEKDMVHPNEVAIDYIWKKFSEFYFSIETINQNKELKKVLKSINHRPLNKESEDYKNFLINTMGKLTELNKSINVEKDLAEIKSRLNKLFKS